MEHLQEMATGVSNGHVFDDVTWPAYCPHRAIGGLAEIAPYSAFSSLFCDWLLTRILSDKDSQACEVL